jgi:hypothetical protein
VTTTMPVASALEEPWAREALIMRKAEEHDFLRDAALLGLPSTAAHGVGRKVGGEPFAAPAADKRVQGFKTHPAR